MKKALVILADKLKGLDAHFVCNIHDEFGIECVEGTEDLVGKLAVESIREAGEYFKFRCPLDGEYKTGMNWSETH